LPPGLNPARLLISTPTPPPPKAVFSNFYFYTKRKEKRTVWSEYKKKKQVAVFMELSSSIDFYIPCTLVILTYVKTSNPPYHPLSPPPLKIPHVTMKAASHCPVSRRKEVQPSSVKRAVELLQ
jgi:hypothetical protein